VRARLHGASPFHVKHRRTAPSAMSSIQFTVVLTLDDVDGASRCAGLRLFESTSVVTSLALQEHRQPPSCFTWNITDAGSQREREATSRVSRGTTSAPNARDWPAELGR
jgi:hypothetical protein